MFYHQESGKKRTPHEEPTTKLIDFGGGSSEGVLFLSVVDPATW